MFSVLETIEDQCSFKFTGRINVLKRTDNQFLGVILIRDGLIVGSTFSKKTGLTALYSLIICDIDSVEDFKLVVEPEIIDEADVEYKIKANDLKKNVQKVYEEQMASNKLRPDPTLRLLINPDFIKNGDKPDFIEFNILKTLVDFNKVEDIYTNCDLFDFEVTRGLVGLRKKGALKVVR